MTARYIAIDWGSTNLRAWLYQGDKCLKSRQSEAGVTRLNGKSPAAVLAEVTQNWRNSATPVVMAGMVGSNVGWKEAPYLAVPAQFSAIGEQLTSVGDPAIGRPYTFTLSCLCHAGYSLQMGSGGCTANS